MTVAPQAPATRGETARIAKALDALPTLPIVATRIAEVLHSKTASVQAVADILRPDPAISAKLLRLINSPYYGVPGGISDVARAIPFIGFNTLYQLVLSISVLEVLDVSTTGFDPRVLWLHSLTAATAARELAVEIGHPDPGTCFTAALLHDMGKIALAKIEPKRTALVHLAMTRDGLSRSQAEALHDLPSHDHIGGVLARHWKFPSTLTVPIEMHHAIFRADVRDRIAPQVRATTEVVAVANDVAHHCVEPFDASVPAPSVDTPEGRDHAALLAALGYTQTQVDALRTRTCTALEKSKVFMSLLEPTRASPRDAARSR